MEYFSDNSQNGQCYVMLCYVMLCYVMLEALEGFPSGIFTDVPAFKICVLQATLNFWIGLHEI